MTETKVFIADDHPIVRKGIRLAFSREKNYNVVGEADDGLKALQGVAAHRPDIAVLDISMPELDGILVAERICKEFPETKVMILSMHQDRQYAVDALQAGAKAYILKSGDSEEILLAAKKVLSGQMYVSAPLADEIMSDFIGILKGEKELTPFDSLTLREREVLKLVAEGCTTKEAAKKLYLSTSTVKGYRVDIMKKLNVKDTAGLVKEAIRHGLIRIENT